MKKLFLTLVFALFVCFSFSQTFTIENIVGKGQYFKGYLGQMTKTEEENWNIKNLSVVNSGDSFQVSYQIYYVRESNYEEIPNDTTWLIFNENCTKLTKKDGNGYTFKYSEYDKIFYDIVISKNLYFDEYNILIMHSVIPSSLVTRGYTVYITLTPEEFEKCQINHNKTEK